MVCLYLLSDEELFSQTLIAGDDAAGFEWVSLNELSARSEEIFFDHLLLIQEMTQDVGF
jgi:hypothetical protein